MSAVIDAWQAVLAAEEAATFGYRRLGPHLSTSTGTARARADQAAHQQAVAQLAAALLAVGLTPVPPYPDYPLAAVLDSDAAAVSEAIRIERAVAAAARGLILVAADPAPDISLPAPSDPPSSAASFSADSSSTAAAGIAAPTQPSGSNPSPPATATQAATVDLPALRRTAQALLSAATVRAMQWGREVEIATAIPPFPGT